jgi:hypothetical protein
MERPVRTLISRWLLKFQGLCISRSLYRPLSPHAPIPVLVTGISKDAIYDFAHEITAG